MIEVLLPNIFNPMKHTVNVYSQKEELCSLLGRLSAYTSEWSSMRRWAIFADYAFKAAFP